MTNFMISDHKTYHLSSIFLLIKSTHKNILSEHLYPLSVTFKEFLENIQPKLYFANIFIHILSNTHTHTYIYIIYISSLV